MSDVSSNFVTTYQAEVHTAYQERGSKLRATVRLKTGVVGATTRFPKIGKGEAAQKTARHADVPAMSVDHDMVACQISDWYAGDYIDKLDEFKVGYDERQAIVQAGAYAVGRKIDNLIIAAATNTANLPAGHLVGDGTTPIGLDIVMEAYGVLNAADAPDDGQRFAVVGPHVWNGLLRIRQFASSDYAGDTYPWLKGTDARRWLNTTWMLHNGLPVTGADDTAATTCLMYHRSALGLAENDRGVISEINYVPHKAAFFANNMIGAGACRIDPSGVVLFKVLSRGYAPDPEFVIKTA